MKTLLDVKTYNRLRKAGYGGMQAFLNDFYRRAYLDGQLEAGLSLREVKEVLLSIKGVGEKRAELILEKLKERLEIEDNIRYVCPNCGKDLTRYKEAKFCPHCGIGIDFEDQEAFEDGDV